jgi:hypothetical protein
MSRPYAIFLMISAILNPMLMSDETQPHNEQITLSAEQAATFARLALAGIEREFPNKPSNVMATAADVRSPQDMHPAFYGSFDWHSSVHGHWMLVRLLKTHPDLDLASEIRTLLASQLTEEKMESEARYFREDHNKSFERMYGWAWLLKLVAELEEWNDAEAQEWRTALRPLEEIIVRRAKDYLPLLSFPIRTGIHPDTGFALALTYDYARVVDDSELEALVLAKAKQFYLHDRDYPAHYEPSGQDFFSSGFNEADLMRRVLTPAEFSPWLDRFLPGLTNNTLGSMMEPVEVPDVTDGHLVHLAGLDLSRAWTMSGIASALPQGDPRRKLLLESAARHTEAGLKYVTSGHYEGEHWLATFAVYHLTDAGIETDPGATADGAR